MQNSYDDDPSVFEDPVKMQAKLDPILLKLNNDMVKQTSSLKTSGNAQYMLNLTFSGPTEDDPPLEKTEYNIRYTNLKSANIVNLDFCVNQGYYLEGAFISEPWKMKALNQLLQDKNGNLARLCFYDVSGVDNWDYLSKEFRKGRGIILLTLSISLQPMEFLL